MPLATRALAAATLLAATALGAQPVADTALRVLPAGAVRVRPARASESPFGVVLSFPGGGRVPVDLRRHTPAATVDSAHVLAAGRRGTATYVLLSVHGLSRSSRNAGRGYCGAGDERAVVALEIRRAPGARPRVQRAGGALYDSCLFTVNQADPEHGLHVAADSAWGEWLPYDRDREHERGEKRPMRYLFGAPERGMHAASDSR